MRNRITHDTLLSAQRQFSDKYAIKTRQITLAHSTALALLALSSMCHAIVPIAPQFDIQGPPGSVAFGKAVAMLPNGYTVVTDPEFSLPGVIGLIAVGAVYLYSPSGALVSTVIGNSANDQIGSGGITVLNNGNYVIHSPLWDNGSQTDAGALTWGDGSTGIAGIVAFANSLIGSTSNDQLGYTKAVALTNGNYVVACGFCDPSGLVDAGAVIWANGASGRTGTISLLNAYVGASPQDRVGTTIDGSARITPLSNGNYVITSDQWHNGGLLRAGAVTWGNGTNGSSGQISTSNSLYGSHADDAIGGQPNTAAEKGGVYALANGNYVVTSPNWLSGRGAITWANGGFGATGAVSNSNSLIGSVAQDYVGSGGVTELTNGRYVIASPYWGSGGVGAVTWIGVSNQALSGVVNASNSLIGASAGDAVGITQNGFAGVTALNNGHFVVSSPLWDGVASNVGAATWVNGTTGLAGVVSANNSFVGQTAGDLVGSGGVTALTNGSYVIASPNWDKAAAGGNAAIVDAGAVTLAPPLGLSGFAFALNSLIGASASDLVGSGGAVALSNGNFVVASPSVDMGIATNVGAVTWVNGGSGLVGPVSAANSLVGSIQGDQVGTGGLTALSDGAYVVSSPFWSASNLGAITWGAGVAGLIGPVSASNSLVGTTSADAIGNNAAVALNNGNYLSFSPLWNAQAAGDVGAVTISRSATGPLNSINSVFGTAAGGGNSLVYSYSPTVSRAAVGRPNSNIVTIFIVSDTVFSDGFETLL